MKNFLTRTLLVLFFLAPLAAAQAQYATQPPTSKLNIATSATLVKPAQGMLVSVAVTTAGSAAGSANDVATTGGVAAGNLMMTIPNTVGVYWVTFPFLTGLVITPGTGQVISVSYQ